MKPTAFLRAILLGSALLVTPSLHAARIYWDSNGLTSGLTDGLGVWLTANQWWNGSTNVSWTSGDDAVFGTGGVGGAVTLASPTTVGSLTFNYFTGTYTLGTASQTITLNNGITSNAGTGAVIISSPITLGAAQTWTNNSTGALTINSTSGGVNLNGNALTFAVNGSGSIDFSGNASNVISGTGGIIKNGTGSLILDSAAPNALHTFTGGITINGGRVGAQTAANLTGRGNVTINGGYLGARFGTNLTFAGGLGTGTTAIQILGGVSGFSGEGGTGSTFTIGASGSTLKWGATGENGATGFFNPTVLLLGGDQAVNANGKGTLANAIDLNGTTRTITSLQTTDGASGSGQTISGAITTSTGTAGLTKTGIGNLILTANNTYNGATTITSAGLQTNGGGAITLSGTNGAINSTSALNLTGTGTLRLVNTAQVNRFADSAAITSNGGFIIYENTSGANTYTETMGSVTAQAGQLNVVQLTNQASTGSQTLTFGGLSQSGAGAVTFSAATTGPQASGNKNMIVITGSGTTSAGNIIGPWATTGTAAANQTDYAVYSGNYVTPAGIAASAQTAWSTDFTTGTGTLNNTLVNAAGSAVEGRFTATRNINSLRANSATNSIASVDFTTNDTITVTGASFADGDVITFGGTPPGGLNSGQPYYVVGSSGATFSVAATSGGTKINLTSAGTGPNITAGITLSSGNNLGTYGILSAQGSGLAIGRSGTGVVTLPTTTSGNLYVTPGNGAVISIAAPIADNGAGLLTLVKNGSATLRLYSANTYTGGTVINSGTLQVGANGVTTGATLGGGNIFIAGGATLDIQTDANLNLSGVISGDGNIVKRYTGTLTLSGANTFTGKFSMTPLTAAGFTVNVSSFNSVVGGTASSSLGAPTTVANGTIDFGSGSVQTSLQINYTGSGETTDRVINFQFNGSNVSRTIDAGSGGGLLKFTSAPTANATASNHIVLQGGSNGEFTKGLPFAFTNLTKSGNGTWTLGGAVGSTGIITVNAGTLALQQRSSLQGGLESNWTAAKINVKSGATLALNVDSTEAAGLNATSLNTLLTNISVAGSATAGLQAGARIGLDTSTATGGTYTQGNAIANSTGANGGAIGLTKLGTGTLILDKTNTYTGSTIVSAGALVINGSTSSTSLVTVASGATLGGTGTVGGATTISGIHSPGNSPGIQTFSSDLTYSGTSPSPVVNWELVGNTSTNAANPNAIFDQIIVGGDLDFADATTLNLSFIAAGSNVLWSNAFWASSQSWTLYDVAGTTTNFADLSLNTINWLDSGSNAFNTARPGSSFSLSQSGDDVLINYNFVPVPEPRAALLGGLGMLMLLRRRR